jgi:hypothetical protein
MGKGLEDKGLEDRGLEGKRSVEAIWAVDNTSQASVTPGGGLSTGRPDRKPG